MLVLFMLLTFGFEYNFATLSALVIHAGTGDLMKSELTHLNIFVTRGTDFSLLHSGNICAIYIRLFDHL